MESPAQEGELELGFIWPTAADQNINPKAYHASKHVAYLLKGYRYHQGRHAD